ncbi:MAG: 50S ribosomal protein L25/general stress protein Ctc [Kiloniellales bacterium]|nr:50S ribosomal protein L25/general stress protein Ctc [Kiloniellales bacterium]MDJ0981047.1 50S ribosomal protein L25/general stress protein Ctc [Kiloniellales bacterium]
MSDTIALPAEPRERVGKGAARAVRRAGRVPAVIYGDRKDPLTISLDPRDVDRELHRPGFFATLFDVEVGGKKHRVLPRDVQLDPVSDRTVHVDFLRVAQDTEVTVNVPVNFTNDEESPGLKRGGVLNIVRHEIEFSCRADAIPQQIEIDLTGLDIGDSVHISMIQLPDGVIPTITDRDFTIATVAAPSAVKAEAAEEQAAAAEGEEGEVPEGEEGEVQEGEGEGEEPKAE